MEQSGGGGMRKASVLRKVMIKAGKSKQVFMCSICPDGLYLFGS